MTGSSPTNDEIEFTPLEIMPRSFSSPAIAGLEFLTGFTAVIRRGDIYDARILSKMA